MVFSIVIGLVILLVILAVLVNAIQQRKEKEESQKRSDLNKQKTIIEETEDLLMSAGSIPISKQLILIMHQRIAEALKSMSQLSPDSKDVKQRLADANNRVTSFDVNENIPGEESFSIPDDDKAVITIIKALKKLRTLLRSEHTKGKVDTHLFMNEDKRLERFQLRINVESLMKRGKAAHNSNMLGSARQYYEKALATVKAQITIDDYVKKITQEIETTLKKITEDLQVVNQTDRQKKAAENADDLDVLFQQKKKW